jgi:hypothetical protein
MSKILLKNLSTISLNALFEEYENAPDRYISDNFKQISLGKILFSLDDLTKSHLPEYLEKVFDDQEFPFLSLKIDFEGVGTINIHCRAIIAFFYSDFEPVKYYTRVYRSYKEFDEGIRNMCYFKFVKGYKSGLEEFDDVLRKRVGIFDSHIDFIGNAVCDLIKENDMRKDPLMYTSIEPFFEYGYKNAMFYKCWDILCNDQLKPFREKIKKNSLLEDGRIVLETDVNTAKEYFSELLMFNHKDKYHKIFTEEQLDSFLRANFIGFGDKTDFVPVKLPRGLKVAIRRYFRYFDINKHKASHRIVYVNLLKSCFIDFENDKIKSLLSNYSK